MTARMRGWLHFISSSRHPALHDRAHARVVDVDARDAGMVEHTWLGKLLKQIVVNKGRIHMAQDGDEPFQHLAQRRDDGAEAPNNAAATEVLDVVGNAFNAQNAFAFAVDLGGEPFEMDFEHRQRISAISVISGSKRIH